MKQKNRILSAILLATVLSSNAPAVTSVITRHQSSRDFLKGTADEVEVTSEGTLRLSLESAVVDCGDLLYGVWSVHCFQAAADGVLYFGTGPDARVIRMEDGNVDQVYPPQRPDIYGDILNEHVFALAQDVAGRLLIAVSGSKGKLVRLSNEPEVVFEDDRVHYIFDIAKDADNNIYLATGPEGIIFRLDPFCSDPQVIYDTQDKNILSLVIDGTTLYAGCDGRGLIYKTDLVSGKTGVLYDSDQDEVSALLVDGKGDLYAATASAKAAMLQLQTADVSLAKSPGRPDVTRSSEKEPTPIDESINAANSEEEQQEPEKKEEKPTTPTPPTTKVAGHIYRISPEGFVEDVFSEIAVFYSLMKTDGKLWAGTGNTGRLYSVDPETEEKAIVHEDEISSQVTSVVDYDGATYLGLSNPARLVRLEKTFVSEGTFKSTLLDASQPARWGKLQIEADIPAGAQVLMSCRSGNLNEPNDSSFSDWAPDVTVEKPMDLECPVGRFCQYRLTLKANDAGQSPEIRQVTVAHAIPNLAPSVLSVQTERLRDRNKASLIQVNFRAQDENKDELEYAIEFRKIGRKLWIMLTDELEQPRFEWDGLTVEDGRYEVRVTANDRKSNSPETMLTGSRVSDVLVIDNTAPEISNMQLSLLGDDVFAKFTVEDTLSVPGTIRYTVDSNEKWVTAQPEDGVSDTLEETFSIQIKGLAPGDHVIALSIADDLENTRYKTYEVTVP